MNQNLADFITGTSLFQIPNQFIIIFRIKIYLKMSCKKISIRVLFSNNPSICFTNNMEEL
ncbi:hypothetical protein D9V84_10825 [Bacteroidetes/Chlorobi group bacterium Naka2016]|nr:MAG: hypothetical protein D9V84_10825 [Bacteroidetes/Chlorobi group bacterium Naka2016]